MITPKYFKKFKCLGGSCPDSCCDAGWEITIDQKAFDRYSRLKGELGERFKSSITTGEEGDCIFKLNERISALAGELVSLGASTRFSVGGNRQDGEQKED